MQRNSPYLWADNGRISSELVMTRHTMDILEDLLGYDVKKFRGLSYYGLVHPEDMKMFSGSMRQLYAKGKATTGYYRLMTRQGSVLWLLTESAVITETTRGQRSQRIHCLHRMLMYKKNMFLVSLSPTQMFANDYEATINTFNETEPTSRVCSMHFTPFSDLIGNDKVGRVLKSKHAYVKHCRPSFQEYNWIGGGGAADDEKREEKGFSRLSQLSPFVNYEDLMELHSEGYNVRLCLQG
ncbi:PAS 3 domain containing protein [Trichuris trichiura]|uniref:PAS 3 domain containing protein n=1 Tax=Trichuris trichiura TaxID=36087 RepID=A0A077YYU2_TRITR|nr:PAS 3 domain containing protein [Trichuris trichiura]